MRWQAWLGVLVAGCSAPVAPRPAPLPAPTRVATVPSATTPPTASATPAPAAPVEVRQIAAGGEVTCALLADRTVRCWGDDQFDIIGGKERENPRPVVRRGLSGVAQIALSAAHACARHEDALVSCWGSNYGGELGLGKPTDPPGPGVKTPTRVPGVSSVTSVATGSATTVLLANGTVMYWGDWDSGTGDPRPAGSAKPALIVGVRGAVEIFDGPMGACARLEHGAVKCWYNVSPGLIPRGKDRVDPVNAPVKDAVALCAGQGYFCARTRSGKHVFWSTLTQRILTPYPGLAKMTDIVEIAFGMSEACARRTDGSVVCEDDSSGALRTVAGLSAVTQIVAGGTHFCALEKGAVLCWGVNTWGQLGDGTTTTRTSPVPVAW
jgi:alpha-tubulin suppressor-like RCC1 family protein